MMKLLISIYILTTLFTACNTQHKKLHPVKQPNILFLLADDLGYGELGSYGQEVIETPVLDKMAMSGMRFTNFYAGNAVCSPSRAVLMTGKQSSINSIRGNKGVYNDGSLDRVCLTKDEITLGEMLKGAGYQTAFIGKWHLDLPGDVSTWAYERGFDYAVQEQWGILPDERKSPDAWEWINGMQDSVFYDINKWNCQDEFRTELAFDYLDNKKEKDKPFFLFMSYRAPHGHERYISNKVLYINKGWPENERMHAAKITLLDKQIGRLLKKLEEMGELENTLIFFTSDNGPHHEGHDSEFFNSNGQLKGIKRDLYEGGIRVPTLAFWKGTIKEGTVSGFIGSGQDFMPTIAEAAGIPVPEQSTGISILPLLKGETLKDREFLNWEFHKIGSSSQNFRQSVRIGKMKGVRYGVNTSTEIYNLEIDISETTDLAADYPELVERVNKIFSEERTDVDYFSYGKQ